VKSSRLFALLAVSASVALLPASALAQRQPASPEQRIDRLERQVEQMQRQVFPRGRPADTAGFAGEPAATQSSVLSLEQRLDALERQMADILRLSEENGHRLQALQDDIAKAKADQDQRISAIEQRMSNGAAAPVTEPAAESALPVTKPAKPPAARSSEAKPVGGPPPVDTAAAATPEEDPGEVAYSEGFHLWEAGNYDAAITSLRAFTSAYPKHRRVSYANNLIGRALLDQGNARAAAQALLANYRQNPKGERAPDSLYYLGEALMKLDQPSQACKAYAELDAVYPKVRADLKKQVEEAKAKAQCS
jgi:TolA-binding protein